MIVWRGQGWTVLPVLLACLYGIPGVWHMQQGQTWAQAMKPNQYGFPFIVALFVAGAILTLWGLFLNRRPAREFVQPETGRTYMATPSHSLYYIKVEYWGVAALLGALLMLVKHA